MWYTSWYGSKNEWLTLYAIGGANKQDAGLMEKIGKWNKRDDANL